MRSAPQDDGKSVLCLRFPLESHSSQMRLECHVASKSVKVPAEELDESLTSGKGGLSGLSTDENTGLK